MWNSLAQIITTCWTCVLSSCLKVQSKHSYEQKSDFHIDIVRSLLFPLIIVKVDQGLIRLEQKVVQLSAWVGVLFGLSFPETRSVQFLFIPKGISVHISKWYHVFCCSAYIRSYWSESRHWIVMLVPRFMYVPPSVFLASISGNDTLRS